MKVMLNLLENSIKAKCLSLVDELDSDGYEAIVKPDDKWSYGVEITRNGSSIKINPNFQYGLIKTMLSHLLIDKLPSGTTIRLIYDVGAHEANALIKAPKLNKIIASFDCIHLDIADTPFVSYGQAECFMSTVDLNKLLHMADHAKVEQFITDMMHK